jgi:hypothetical protein
MYLNGEKLCNYGCINPTLSSRFEDMLNNLVSSNSVSLTNLHSRQPTKGSSSIPANTSEKFRGHFTSPVCLRRTNAIGPEATFCLTIGLTGDVDLDSGAWVVREDTCVPFEEGIPVNDSCTRAVTRIEGQCCRDCVCLLIRGGDLQRSREDFEEAGRNTGCCADRNADRCGLTPGDLDTGVVFLCHLIGLATLGNVVGP